MRVRTPLLVLQMIALASPGLFFWRKDDTAEQRRAAQREILHLSRTLLTLVAEMKSNWLEEWEAHDELELPPKYHPHELYPDFILDSARDALFARRLLQRNRWNSRVEPLFENVNEEAWARLRATIVNTTPRILVLRDQHRDLLRADERASMERCVEHLGEYLRKLRRAEHPASDMRLVTDTTFIAVYSMEMLISSFVERSVLEAQEES